MEKHKKIDTKAIEYHIAGILKALGDNPEREGLIMGFCVARSDSNGQCKAFEVWDE